MQCTVVALCEHSTVIAERSEPNNRVLWAQQSQLAFIYVYISTHPWGQGTCSKWRLWQFFGCRLRSRGSQRVRGLDKFVMLFCQEKAYYSSQVCRNCVALLQAEI